MLGYCYETPKDVLSYIYTTHNVYKYKDLRCPVDCSQPNDSEGLIIEEISPVYIDIIAIGKVTFVGKSLDTFDFGIAETTNKRDNAVFRKALREMKNNQIDVVEDSKRYKMLMEQYYEVESVLFPRAKLRK